MKRFTMALCCALMLAAILGSSALAHAKFVKSEPAPDAVLSAAPTQVTIWFTEELDTKLSNVKVFDAANAQVDLGSSKVNLDDRKQMSVGVKPLTGGVFTVKWHAVSDDDKGESDGDFKFTVRVQTTPTVSVSPTAAATTALTVPSAATSVPTRALTVPPAVVTAPATPATTPSGSDFTLPIIILAVVVLLGGTLVVLRRG